MKFLIKPAIMLSIGLLSIQSLSQDVIGPKPAVSTKVLLVGDSHTAGTFGSEMNRLFRELYSDSTVTTIGSCGSSPNWWYIDKTVATNCGYYEHRTTNPILRTKVANTPKYKNLKLELNPEISIIALGANLSLEPSDDVVHKQISTLAALTSGTKCFWIGPPDSRKIGFEKRKRIATIAKEESEKAGCLFIDSLELTSYPATGGDGTHYDSICKAANDCSEGRALAASWAQEVFNKIRAELKL